MLGVSVLYDASSCMQLTKALPLFIFIGYMYICVSLSLYIYIYMHLSLYIYIYIYIHINIYIYIYPRIDGHAHTIHCAHDESFSVPIQLVSCHLIQSIRCEDIPSRSYIPSRCMWTCIHVYNYIYIYIYTSLSLYIYIYIYIYIYVYRNIFYGLQKMIAHGRPSTRCAHLTVFIASQKARWVPKTYV